MSNIIADCPVCKQGQLKEEDANFRCNHFKSMEDKCDFIIWKNFFGKNLTASIVKEICEKGRTSFLDGFTTKDGREFSAALTINEYNKVAFATDTQLEDVTCVACEGNIIETAYAYKCENTFNNTCGMNVPKSIAQKTIDRKDVLKLLKGETTDFIDGFKAKNGNEFSAKLFVDDNDFSIKFDSSITNCPVCKTGNIREFEKSFSCSNYKEETPCNFSIWKFQFGGEVSRKNVIELCSSHKTSPINFTTKEGGHPYMGILSLDDENKISMDRYSK